MQCMLGDTGNKRAVRILLECNLVYTARAGFRFPSQPSSTGMGMESGSELEFASMNANEPQKVKIIFRPETN